MLIEEIEIVGGEHELHIYSCEDVPGHEGEHVTELWRLREIAYGDLDGDGDEDVAVSFYEYGFACRDEDDERLTRIRTFRLTDGHLEPIGEAATGIPDDGALAAVPTLEITNGEIVRAYPWRNGTTCRDRWRWVWSGLEQIGPPCT